MVELFNDQFAGPARAIMANLYAAGLISPIPFLTEARTIAGQRAPALSWRLSGRGRASVAQ